MLSTETVDNIKLRDVLVLIYYNDIGLNFFFVR
jgi:hypothetical protein